MYTNNYPKEWYRKLKKGDIVKCVKRKHPGTNLGRVVGKEYKVRRDSKGDTEIHYGEGSARHDMDDFIPIKMQAYPELNIVDNYDVY